MFLIFFKLLVLHYLADYAAQGDFLAKAKNHTQPLPGVPWQHALLAHAVIHGGAVWLVTGSLWLAGVEIVMHAALDYHKCDGTINYNQDQLGHIWLKVIYAGIRVS